MDGLSVRSGGHEVKKALTLFIIFMFVFASNLIAAPITVNDMDALTKSSGDTWHPEGGTLTMPVFDETMGQGIQGNALNASLGPDHEMLENSGSLSINNPEATVTHNPVAPVPEPASLLLLGVGMLSAGFFARKKKKNS